MARIIFYWVSCLSIAAIVVLGLYWDWVWWFICIAVPLILVGIYDHLFSTHNVLRNYPVVGHLRYILEFISPELQQYFIETNQNGRPYPREVRALIKQRAKQVTDEMPFGTQHDFVQGYSFLGHSIVHREVLPGVERLMIGGEACQKPYSASRLNVTGMSFGALSKNAVMALNLGAKLGGFAQNTGEGGLTPYHLQQGGDIFMQVGTANFGVRHPDGSFDPEQFQEKAALDVVKMIEIKISQGAKPSLGGILPARKITKEIAEIRGVPMGQDCLSPPGHPEFSTPLELIQFVARLRELSAGKPVGFKLCIGQRSDFMAICKAMLETNIYPDFITIDGAEGGTGAAPVEFSNRVGMPINQGLSWANQCLVGCGIRSRLHLIASGKVATGFDMIAKMALGADVCHAGRAFLFTVGCIQARRCHTNTCPTGVTTQDPKRMSAIIVKEKGQAVRHYHDATIQSLLNLLGAMGLEKPEDLTPEHIYQCTHMNHSTTYAEILPMIGAGELLGPEDQIPMPFQRAWQSASAAHFYHA